MSWNPEFTFAAMDIGLGNQACLANLASELANSGLSIHSITTDGILTSLARMRQTAMTLSPDDANSYTANQSSWRQSRPAKLLGQEGLTQILRRTQKRQSSQPKVLITASELYFLPIIDDLAKTLSPYFTHLMMIVPDVEPKPSALEIIRQSKRTPLPITPIVWNDQARRLLTSEGITSIYTRPFLPPLNESHSPTQEPISILKESGTGMDQSSFSALFAILARLPHPLHVMHQDLSIETGTSDFRARTNPLSLKAYYAHLSRNQVAAVATHPSEMVMALAQHPPQEVHLAQSRGPHEVTSALWLSSHYSEFTPLPNPLNPRLIHLTSNSTTTESIHDTTSHTSFAPALLSFLKML